MNAKAYVLEWLKMVQLILKFENCESKSNEKSELANDREHTNSNLEMEV